MGVATTCSAPAADASFAELCAADVVEPARVRSSLDATILDLLAGLPAKVRHRQRPVAVEAVEVERRRGHDLAACELVGRTVLVAERDLPDEQPEERRDPDERDRLADALDLPGHAATMNTGVPTSTCSKSHSTCGISMRTQPCDAE